MKLKVLFSLIAITACTSTFAYTSTTINVTDAVLASQQNTAMPWQLTKNGDSIDLENETNSPINVTIKVLTASFTKGTYLGLSSTWVDKGVCGEMGLKPGETVSCNIDPSGHLTLLYMTDLLWDQKTLTPFNGLYTLSTKLIS